MRHRLVLLILDGSSIRFHSSLSMRFVERCGICLINGPSVFCCDFHDSVCLSPCRVPDILIGGTGSKHALNLLLGLAGCRCKGIVSLILDGNDVLCRSPSLRRLLVEPAIILCPAVGCHCRAAAFHVGCHLVSAVGSSACGCKPPRGRSVIEQVSRYQGRAAGYKSLREIRYFMYQYAEQEGCKHHLQKQAEFQGGAAGFRLCLDLLGEGCHERTGDSRKKRNDRYLDAKAENRTNGFFCQKVRMAVQTEREEGEGNQGNRPELDPCHEHFNGCDEGRENDRERKDYIGKDYADASHPKLAYGFPYCREGIDSIDYDAVRHVDGGGPRCKEAELLEACNDRMGNAIGAVHPVFYEEHKKADFQHLHEKEAYLVLTHQPQGKGNRPVDDDKKPCKLQRISHDDVGACLDDLNEMVHETGKQVEIPKVVRDLDIRHGNCAGRGYRWIQKLPEAKRIKEQADLCRHAASKHDVENRFVIVLLAEQDHKPRHRDQDIEDVRDHGMLQVACKPFHGLVPCNVSRSGGECRRAYHQERSGHASQKEHFSHQSSPIFFIAVSKETG